MDPIDSSMSLGHTFDNKGEVYLQKAISVVYPCTKFHVNNGGKLIWPGEWNITIECDEVFINGIFKPGTINFGAGALTLKIGSEADFEFTADGPILTNSFWASGTTKIKNIAEFKSLNETDERIATFYLDTDGKLYLSTQSQPKLVNGSQVKLNFSSLFTCR